MANEFVLRKGLISLGGVTFPLTQVNGTYTVLPTDYFVEATGNSFTINLPSAVGISGQTYEIKNSGSGVVVVDANGSQTIDGVLTKTLNQYDNLFITSNGANWIVTGGNGTSGTSGLSGVNGTDGANGQSSSVFPYSANTTSTSGDPGTAHILWNNVTQVNSSQININHIDEDNIDIDLFLAVLGINQKIVLQDRINSANYQIWNITGATTQVGSTYWTVPVQLIDSGGTGTTGFASEQELVLAITVSNGTSGTSGTSGSSGTSGTSGTSFEWEGIWGVGTTYRENDVVYYDGSSYI